MYAIRSYYAIELAGTMLIGTDAQTLAVIMEPFDILSLGFNCGTGPEQYTKHVKALSEVWGKPISIHANAGLPQNRGGYTFYPMGPDEFADRQESFLAYDGVSFLGGCCGTTRITSYNVCYTKLLRGLDAAQVLPAPDRGLRRAA